MKAKPTFEQTQRALMALATDMRDAEEAAARVRAQVFALAMHHGVELPL